MSLPAYAKYKPSGVEWLGELPDHWGVKPLRYTTDFVNGMAFKPDSWSTSGIPIVRIENLNGGSDFNCFEGDVPSRFHVQAGDLLFGWSGNRGTSFGPFRWSRHGLHYLNQHIFKLTAFTCDGTWFYWCLKAVTRTIEDEAHGIIGMVHVTRGKLGAVPIPVVPHAEQRAIADFLDRETAKIDALVAKKRTLIERLKEKRTALITRTVTRGLPPATARAAGLDPNPKLKPSGLAWLGDIPNHWCVAAVRAVARVGNGSTPDRDNGAYWDGGSYPWLNSSVANQEDVTAASDLVTPCAMADCHLPRISPPAVLVGITGQGRTRGMATTLRIEATINQHLAFVKPEREIIEVGFLRRVFDAAYEFLRSESDGGGSTKGAITCEQIGQLRIPIPPVREQQVCERFLSDGLRSLDSAAAVAETAIDRLLEYRTALITAAVTGKIDVRGAETKQAPTTPRTLNPAAVT